MKSRDKIIIATVTVAIVLAVGVSVGVVVSRKERTDPDPDPAPGPSPPSQSDACPPNTLCRSEGCDAENPFAGTWRLVGGENRDIQVFDGAQEFEMEVTSVNPSSGALVLSSTADAFNNSVLTLHFLDEVDAGTGNRVVGLWADARIYALDYQDHEPYTALRYRHASTTGGDIQTPAGVSFFKLAELAPGSPDYDGCVTLDAVDLGALCATSTSPTSCMYPDMPLYLERVQ